ncbi:MAG: hypothetical protein ACW99U_09730 [Candidatus Thorarchaeota archaeon]|jgi:predicted RNA-binding Zn-ribbon protein involved in translation (DUF1610 family)
MESGFLRGAASIEWARMRSSIGVGLIAHMCPKCKYTELWGGSESRVIGKKRLRCPHCGAVYEYSDVEHVEYVDCMNCGESFPVD